MITKVLICNERFLARFGVDRILILLARALRDRGDVELSFACLRYSEDALAPISRRITLVALPEGLDVAASEAFAAETLITSWKDGDAPDVIVTGGWPFFTLAARAQSLGVHSLFIDAGAVPHEGFPEGPLQSQLELRRVRRLALPRIGAVVAISDFIRRTQSVSDRGRDDVTVTLLGADHLEACRFDPSTAPPYEKALIEDLRHRTASGSKILISLGRFEAFGYKNSSEIFDIARTIAARGTDVCVMLLTGPDQVAIPADVDHLFLCAATLSDDALQEAMRLSDVGVALTLWEGFDLPLAEMQWLGKPVLSYLVGAHPEVAVHPWFLCASRAELSHKLDLVVSGSSPETLVGEAIYDAFRRRMTWGSTLAAWIPLVLSRLAPDRTPARRLVVIDVSNSARDPANSGVIRVTRRLTAELSHHDRLDVVFAIWDARTDRYLRLERAHLPFLSSNAGPFDILAARAFVPEGDRSIDPLIRAADPACAAPPLLFMPEVILDGSADRRVEWARERGLKTAFIFYDMLPIYEPQHISPDVAAAFPAYLKAIAHSDAFWAISGFSLSEFERYARDRSLTLPDQREAVWLPGQFSDNARSVSANRSEPRSRIDLLCVSTIEPRKNHRVLIDAFQRLRARRPELQVFLTLVGNSYASADDLAAWVRQAAVADNHLVWHGIVTDAFLAERYNGSEITVYPSLAEGFGLPILESLWMGLPCLCNDSGVMAELAVGGGCMTVDMGDPDAVSFAIEALATDDALRLALSRQAASRRIETWADYGARVADLLSTVGLVA